MKKKIHKIWGVGLTLVLATTMLLFPVPASADTLAWGDEDLPDELEEGSDVRDLAVGSDGETIYAAAPFVSVATLGGTDPVQSAWSTDQKHSGASSAKLYTIEPHVCVDFVPQSGTTVADLADADAEDFGFWYHLSVLRGPQLELKFTAPDSDDYVDIFFMLQGLAETVTWTEVDLSTDFGAIGFWGKDGVTTLNKSVGGWTLADALAELETDLGAEPWATVQDWELTQVRVELYDEVGPEENRTCYIDDVTIAGSTYDLEGVNTTDDPGEASAGNLYRSTNAGESWSRKSTDIDPDLVAVAPDDEDFIAIADTNPEALRVHISDDGGASWDDLGAIEDDPDVLATITALAISPESGGSRYVAVAGLNVTVPNVFYFEPTATVTGWTATRDEGMAADLAIGAIEFSPNFASDEVMVAVTMADAIGAEGPFIFFEIYSFDTPGWNPTTFADDYPVEIVAGDDLSDSYVDGLVSASIALGPDYLGSDSDLRIAFVGITTDYVADTEDEADGIFRLEDDDVEALKDEYFIHSVAFDGTDLVAGRFDSNTVYRCADPLDPSPSVKSTGSNKTPGSAGPVVVAFADDLVVAGTSGAESAFSVSTDSGKSFNDISLIDTALSNLTDVAVSPDGSIVYLVSDDGADMSLWRLEDRWERVLLMTGGTGFIVRLASEDADTVYVAQSGGEDTIYVSSDGGQTKWRARSCTVNIQDMAVESAEVVYVLTDQGGVTQSTNSGFTWSSEESTGLDTGNMIVSLGEDLLLVGGQEGGASYSTDGNESWEDLGESIPDGTLVQVTATGLADGDFIYAAAVGDTSLYRWELGEDDDWDNPGDFEDALAWVVEDPAATYEVDIFGIATVNGFLYAVGFDDDETISFGFRSINPSGDADVNTFATDDGVVFNAAPSALRVSAGSTVLWALDSGADGPAIFTYEDTISTEGPELVQPASGATTGMNQITGRALDINFVWEKPSDDVEVYALRIGLDEDFDEIVRTMLVENDEDTVSQIVGPFAEDDEDGENYQIEFLSDTTYYWKVQVESPVYSPWSEVRSFTIGEAEAIAPVTIAPTPEITVAVPPAPAITIQPPEIIIPTPEIVLPAPQVTLPPSPAPVAPIPGWALYIIIIIGAVLVLALIVLILRTRRPV